MTVVSIVIPFRNRADYLPRTLQSVLAQTYRPLQLILVDNGSTDNSWDVASRFQTENEKADFQIRLTSEGQLGAPSARNKGLSLAQGKYVYFFDSDDEMTDGFLQSAVAKAEDGQLDLVAAVTTIVLPDGSTQTRNYGYSPYATDQILTGMLSTQAMLLRTDFLQTLHGWNETLLFWNDWELGIRVLSAHPKMAWLKGKTFHRIYAHPDSITGMSFHHAFGKIRVAFECVEQFLSARSEDNTRPSLLALNLRKAIIAGHLYHEGFPKQASDCLKMIHNEKASPLTQWICQTIYFYTRMGGRGAWRIASKYVRYALT